MASSAPVPDANLPAQELGCLPKPPIGPDDQMPCIKRSGLAHPLKPRTPNQLAEFAALWHNPNMTVPQIAKRYRCGDRTIQKWRVEFRLGAREAGRRFATQAATVANAAGAIVQDVGEAVKASEKIMQAQAILGIELGIKALQDQRAAGEGKLVPLGPGGQFVDPQVMARSCNPLNNSEVAALLEEVRQEARQITQHSDLTALQRKLAKLTILCATQMPAYTWESLQAILDSLSRAVLWSRKVEADIPQGKVDPVLLRQEAGAQMMKELRGVLGPDEQAALARLVKLGADRIMARATGGRG